MNALEGWAADAGWIMLTLCQALIVALLLVTIRPFQQA